MGVEFETARLRARRFTPADVPLLVELDSDPEVMRYLSGGRPTPEAVVRERILPRILAEYDRRCLGTFALEVKATGQFIGWVSLRTVGHEPGVAELGYRLRRGAWGHGFATEAATAVIDRAFAFGSIRRVVATTYEENLPSRRVMERLGMRFVRSFRLSAEEAAAADSFEPGGGEPWDGEDVEYAIERHDWLANHPRD